MDINDLTYKLNGAIFEVNRVLGPGVLEKVYENALMMELRSQGINAESQVPIKVHYKGNVVGDYFADIIVENLILMELKASERLDKIHEALASELSACYGVQSRLAGEFYPSKSGHQEICSVIRSCRCASVAEQNCISHGRIQTDTDFA